MITLKTLRWSNAFSYGEDNWVDFSGNPLTQILGFNGHGKSSIALILEEVLYNKNSKGIKKADVLNRNSSSKTYKIELTFEKDGDNYEVTTVRGATQSVKLTKNGEDISSHTSTGTYKTLEEIIGYDHKTFAQIVYQSSSSSLEFLTATDSNRKKFLIELLNLSRYVEAGETFKDTLKGVTEELAKVSAQIKTVTDWIERYSKVDLSPQEMVPVPSVPLELVEQNSELRDKLKNLESINKKIIQNNKYKEILDGIIVEIPGDKPVFDLLGLTGEKAEHSKLVKDCDSFVARLAKLGTQCVTCLQDIDQHKVHQLVDEQNASKATSKARLVEIEEAIKKGERDLSEWNRKNSTKEEYERYYALYDPALEKTIYDKAEIVVTIEANDIVLADSEKAAKKATEHNQKVAAHNARIDVIKTQLEEYNTQLVELRQQSAHWTSRQNTLQLLVKTFSSTGLIAYKIECLVKDLETVTNSYLAELSGGRFQLAFKVSGNDKLNVVITDHGKDIEIIALSGGERARVNVAALLGIRKLMQSLSNTRINLLILDETIENLDLEGKEKLVEVLLKEEYLNTFLISHGFSHPLLEKLTVVKSHNISRVEHG